MKFVFKMLAAPVVLILTIIVWLCALLLWLSAYLLGLAGTVIGLIGLAVLLACSVKNGFILLVIAFLVSPLGLPMLAARMLGLLQDLNYTLRDFIIG